ncbi:pyruvate decarboxylase [Penicillium cosmopolitanum]|uniref:Pyruvate decarboxylase n=1 Tax=Penicillium cosmopolitanum TaxID=1131564 RepID=A0A9W9SCA5_9EURO|nr:pyruvate decarboxylase [Penicillium cosmopolitanum]KAJ5376036.1 pyruvate decarboxylase [Penicillium cosmopolitanum]
MSGEIPLTEYLFRRLRSTGLRAVHGVPGDYNLTLLDHVIPSGLEWVGNCNELNAAYAADGYARIKGIGAIVTTFGVGELSAINAIAGSYAEMAPVVHIVGTPVRALQEKGVKLHHTFCSGSKRDYELFAEMYAKVTVAQADLVDIEHAPGEIDRVIRECILQSRPVYIQLPMDLVDAKVPVSLLDQELDLKPAVNDVALQSGVCDILVHRIMGAKQPLILVDGGTSRYGLSKLTEALVKVTNFPTTTTPFGKGIMDETLPNFHGIYATVGDHDYTSYVNSCDLIINIGPVHSNVNTYYFATVPDKTVTITIERDSIQVGERIWKISPASVLDQVISTLTKEGVPKIETYPTLPNMQQTLATLPTNNSPADRFAQTNFWRRMSRFLRSGDIILTETGTPSMGGRDFILPQNTTIINSAVWLSIGFMLPATQGAALAQRHLSASESQRPAAQGRTILFQGDGSFQMTAQELSTIIRNRLDVIIFLINNNGYTIERLIHGPEEHYNDVASWRYLEAPSFFGAEATSTSYPIFKAKVSTWGELDRIMDDREFHSGKGLRMVEVMMEMQDCNDTLRLLLDIYKTKKG